MQSVGCELFVFGFNICELSPHSYVITAMQPHYEPPFICNVKDRGPRAFSPPPPYRSQPLNIAVALSLEGVDLVMIDVISVVSRSSVVGYVKSSLLLDGVDSEEVEVLKEEEVGTHEAGGPSDDPEDTNQLGSEEVGVPVAVVGGPLVEPTDVLR